MKYIFCLCLSIIGRHLQAQENISPTNDFTIEGMVKAPFTFSLNNAAGFSTIAIDSVVIYNHLHERKRAIKNIKGILLKDILDRVVFDAPGTKVLSEFYMVCIASDNYKVVFSWNELFNTEVGKHVIIITGENGKTGMELDDRIALLSPADDATGRRFVKGLKKIIIERVK
jgi:uncharacterized protein YbaA (DUF1428 family)